MNKNPLLDEEFLKELYRHREKEVFAKIVALTLNHDPIEEIQGQVTGGSVSLDGASSVRRTCNLSLVAKDLNINQYYWGLKNRFRLYIGLRNVVGWDYDDIIWFPMGTYVISNFTTSQSTTSYTINITGKDKMCLLNGELSGSLFASVDFGKEEYYNRQTRETTINYIPIKTIIREAVHAYADEAWENIIINDLEDYGLELLDYKGEDPMYMLFELGSDNTKEASIYYLDGTTIVYPVLNWKQGPDEEGNYEVGQGIEISRIEDDGYTYDERIELDLGGIDAITATRFCIGTPGDDNPLARKKIYTIAKIINGQTCGYRLTDITYPGDLILSVGEPLTALFDKLVAMLGNFEYFYDLDGRFIFQRKQIFVDKSWNNIKTGNDTSYVPTLDETYAEAAAYATPITWTFGDSFLITAYANNPVLSNVRNDFSIWGTKASVTGTELPVHLRYAVDKKPTYYKTIEYTKTDDNGNIIIDETTGEPKIFGGKEWTTEIGHWWIKEGAGIVDITYDELVKLVREEAKDKIRKRIKMNINAFEPSHEIIDGLQKPIRQSDGSWTSGWWDIRDWHDYYVALTGQEPRGTMKWYSHNDLSGAIKVDDFIPQLEAQGYHSIFPYNPNTDYCWLIEVDTVTKAISIQHGYGNPNRSNERYYYETYLNGETVNENANTINGVYNIYYDDQVVGKTYRIYQTNPETNEREQIHKEFIYPYAGCADSHTYMSFLIEDMEIYGDNEEGNGTIVYFYAPNFPAMEEGATFEEYIEQEVAKQLTKEEIDAIIAEKGYREVTRDLSMLCDWREIIFQMALDYRLHNHDDDFYLKVRMTNGLDLNNQWYYPNGKTGYEQYYVDMEGFWRQLYCPPQLMKELYPSGVWTERDQDTLHSYFSTGEIIADSDNGIYFGSSSGIVYQTNYAYKIMPSYDDWNNMEWVNSWIQYQDTNDGWNTEILDSPENLNFWFDFLDADESTDLVRYSVPAIGDRAKSVNDSKVKAIYFRETPNALFTESVATVDKKSGYTYLQYQPEMITLFNISSQGKSAYDVMEEYINNYLYCIETISITSVPIYHLQPNTRVMVYDEDSKINGEYLVNKITIPLIFNGTMSVSAVKSAEIIY